MRPPACTAAGQGRAAGVVAESGGEQVVVVQVGTPVEGTCTASRKREAAPKVVVGWQSSHGWLAALIVRPHRSLPWGRQDPLARCQHTHQHNPPQQPYQSKAAQAAAAACNASSGRRAALNRPSPVVIPWLALRYYSEW